jgi:hypothetical protein
MMAFIIHRGSNLRCELCGTVFVLARDIYYANQGRFCSHECRSMDTVQRHGAQGAAAKYAERMKG